MKFYTAIYVIVLLLIFITDHYLYKYSEKRNIIQKIKLVFPTFFFSITYTAIKIFGANIDNYRFNFWLMWFNLFFLTFYILRIIYVFLRFFQNKYPARITEIKSVYYMLSGAFVIVMFWSVFMNPLNMKVEMIQVVDKELPASFNNYKIVQISDAHLGARMLDKRFFSNVVKKINEQNADIVVFTGDFVNNFAGEFTGFDTIFAKIKAKDGKFAILGNHDYGDYSVWKTAEAKELNLMRIMDGIARCGFKIIENEHVFLHRDTDSIALVGVGNYHATNTQKNYSDLTQAMKDIPQSAFQILLTHNPVHWEVVQSEQPCINLLLSGHTHAGQFGFDINGKVYSPIVFHYSTYNGLYTSNGQQLYVNRGIGYIGLPMIIGLKPEITVLTLQQKVLK